MIDVSFPKLKSHSFAAKFFMLAFFGLMTVWFFNPGLGSAQETLDDLNSPYFGGEKLFHEGRYADAKAVFQEFLERHPNDPRKSKAVFRLGQIEYRNGFYVSALKYFRLFEDHYSDSTWVFHARLMMGECYFHLEKYEKAAKLFLKTAKTSPDPGQKWKAYFYLGQIDDRREDYLSAVQKFKRLVEHSQDEELKQFSRQSIQTIIREKLNPEELAHLANQMGTEYPAELVLTRLIEVYRDERNLGNYQIALENFLIRFPQDPLSENYNVALKTLRDDKDRPIRIATVLPLSGKRALLGQQVLQGIQLAFSQLEHQGQGKVELIVKDSGLGLAAPEVIEDLAKDPNVVAVIGPVLSWEVQEVIPVIESYRLPIFSPSASTTGLGEMSPYVFRNALTKEIQARFLARYAVNDLNIHRLVVLYPTEIYGEVMREVFEEELKSLGGEVVVSLPYDRSQNDFREQILSMGGVPDDSLKNLVQRYLRKGVQPPPLDDKGVVSRPLIDGGIFSEDESEGLKVSLEVNYDGIFIPGFYDKVGLMIPQFAFYNIENVPFLGGNGWNSPELVEIARHYLKSVLFVDGFFVKSHEERQQNFVESFQKRFGQVPNILSAQAYDTANMILKTLEAGANNRLDVKRGLESISNYPGAAGNTTVMPNGDMERSLIKLSVVNGEIIQVD